MGRAHAAGVKVFLVNAGTRGAITSSQDQAPNRISDLNPADIESVEILKDGASATYGADAVAGVVNFKLRHAVKGGEIDLLYGNTNLGVANDAAVRTGYLVSGLAGDKYNLTAGASYYDRGAIFARDTFLSSLVDRRRLGGTNAQCCSLRSFASAYVANDDWPKNELLM